MFCAVQVSGIQNICDLSFEFDRNRQIFVTLKEENSLIGCFFNSECVGDSKFQGPNQVLSEGLCQQQAVAGSPMWSSVVVVTWFSLIASQLYSIYFLSFDSHNIYYLFKHWQIKYHKRIT